MRKMVSFAMALALSILSACASFDLVRPPAREADLYPSAEMRSGVVVAVDVISDPDRAQRYFGARLPEEGILPVQVVVSNRSVRPIAVRPSDVLLVQGSKVVDPVPLERVSAIARNIARNKGLFVTSDTTERVDTFFEEVSFRHANVSAGQSYQGVLFFPTVPKQRRGSRYFRVVSLFPQPTLSLRIAATEMETRERIHFGPFGLIE